MSKPANILVIIYAYLRLSRENDGSASIDTQRSAYLAWLDGAEFQRWLTELGVTRDQVQVVEYVDAGVSGAKPLEMRKHMKRLMQDVDRSIREDRANVVRRMMISWKLDRYARSVSEFLRLTAWGEARNLRIATTDNTINTATATGRMVAVVLAALAQWEREMIRDRIIGGHETRRAQGRWGSGRPPYPYDIEKRDGAAYLVPNEERVAKTRAGVLALISPDGKGTVAGTCHYTGLSEPQWRRLLKSPVLRGHREHKGKLICGPDGVTPIQFAEPVINAAERKAVLKRLKALATGEDRAPSHAANLCAGMGFCYKCSGPLNGGGSNTGVRLYKCKAGHVTIYAETLDKRVEADFMERWGNMPEYVVRLEGGNDMSDAMAEAEEQAARITAGIATAGPLMLASLQEKAAELEAAYAALRDAHDPEVREVLEPTGRTLGGTWKANPDERSRLLADVGLHVVLHPKQRADRLEISWAIGGDDQEVVEYLGDLDWQETHPKEV